MSVAEETHLRLIGPEWPFTPRRAVAEPRADREHGRFAPELIPAYYGRVVGFAHVADLETLEPDAPLLERDSLGSAEAIAAVAGEEIARTA